MKMATLISQFQDESADETLKLLTRLEKAEEICRKCHSLSPLFCASQCDVWGLKREFRLYYEKMTRNDYWIELLNALKNRRRLEILNMLSNRSASLAEIQKNLKNLQCNHSQQTIIKEYLEPLVNVGLIIKGSSSYSITLLGYEINKLFKEFPEIARILQPRSKCYEEIILRELLKSPKKYEELKTFVLNESLSRVLKRLQKGHLISKSDKNNYIFYFKTKRNPREVKLSSTERRVYENIPTEGSTAEGLAIKAHINLRRTYKYLKRLRGKKLVFKRKNPKTYTLTTRGMQIASLLENVAEIIRSFKEASIMFMEKPITVQTLGATRKSRAKLAKLQ